MAADAYISIVRIRGESTDSTHQGWLECVYVDLRIVQSRSATPSTGGGHTTKRAEVEELTILKHAVVCKYAGREWDEG